MRPIRDISDLNPESVLYHSAFGFAEVVGIGEADVAIRWENDGANLPRRVSREALTRVYSLCSAGGFFDKALKEPDELRDLFQIAPIEALILLLQDLAGPQQRDDLRDWVTSRQLMSPRAFDAWWDDLQPLLSEDGRFSLDNGQMSLQRRHEPGGPREQLANPLLAPSRRLDIALKHRRDIGMDAFRDQALLAWRTGGKQVRDLALAALKNFEPDEVLAGLLAPGPDNLEALIHAIRRGGWTSDQVAPAIHAQLLDRVREAVSDGGPLDNEGRLAAALVRWGARESDALLLELADNPRGQALVASTLAALAPRRVVKLALELLEEAVRTDRSEAAGWFAQVVLAHRGGDHLTLAAHIEDEHPAVAAWLRTDYARFELVTDDTTDESLQTLDIDLEPVIELDPVPISDLPPRAGATVIALGQSMAAALARLHAKGDVVNPTRLTTRVRLDGGVDIQPGGVAGLAPRPPGEAPSTAGDVFSAGTLLIEALLGKPWPRNISADRAIPYLRAVVPDLPPAALAPFDCALHPDPSRRPQDGAGWLAHWEVAANSERDRRNTDPSHRARLQVGYDSHIGRSKLLSTQTNQDALYVGAKGPITLMAVCDGISTANAGSGDVASGITAHVVASLWEQAITRLGDADDDERREFLSRALRMANRAVCEAALRFAGGDLEGRVPMGTTSVVAVSRGNRISLAWLGDSRAYLVGRYGAALLTADQNQACERLVDWHRGEEPAWDPAGFALVGYVGHFDEWSRPDALHPSHLSFTLLPGERLVICSDGVTDYLAEAHPMVADQLAACALHGTPDEAARALVDLANRGGGGDNATVTVAGLRSE